MRGKNDLDLSKSDQQDSSQDKYIAEKVKILSLNSSPTVPKSLSLLFILRLLSLQQKSEIAIAQYVCKGYSSNICFVLSIAWYNFCIPLLLHSDLENYNDYENIFWESVSHCKNNSQSLPTCSFKGTLAGQNTIFSITLCCHFNLFSNFLWYKKRRKKKLYLLPHKELNKLL